MEKQKLNQLGGRKTISLCVGEWTVKMVAYLLARRAALWRGCNASLLRDWSNAMGSGVARAAVSARLNSS